MIQELVYTSAPQGLKPGSRGFCTVASTPGMARNLADQLEALSGYRHIFDPHEKRSSNNPVAYSHLRVRLGGSHFHILSRVADAGLDYTRRTNKIAHHVVLDAADLPQANPARLMSQPDFFLTEWSAEPRTLATTRRIAAQAGGPAVCRAWAAITGDAGWGGVVAEALLNSTVPNVSLICPPNMEVLPLLAESLALLPPRMLWRITFSTYFTKLPPGIDCRCRFLISGTAEAKAAARSPHGLCLNLCDPLGKPPDSSFVAAARSGQVAASREPVRQPQELGFAEDSADVVVRKSADATPGNRSPQSLERLLDEEELRPGPPIPPMMPTRASKRRFSRTQIKSDSSHKGSGYRLATILALVASLVILLGGAALIVTDNFPSWLAKKADQPVPTDEENGAEDGPGPQDEETPPDDVETVLDECKTQIIAFENQFKEQFDKESTESLMAKAESLAQSLEGEGLTGEERRAQLDSLDAKISELNVMRETALESIRSVQETISELKLDEGENAERVKTLFEDADLLFVAFVSSDEEIIALGERHQELAKREMPPAELDVNPPPVMENPLRDVPQYIDLSPEEISSSAAHQPIHLFPVYTSELTLTLLGGIRQGGRFELKENKDDGDWEVSFHQDDSGARSTQATLTIDGTALFLTPINLRSDFWFCELELQVSGHSCSAALWEPHIEDVVARDLVKLLPFNIPSDVSGSSLNVKLIDSPEGFSGPREFRVADANPDTPGKIELVGPLDCKICLQYESSSNGPRLELSLDIGRDGLPPALQQNPVQEKTQLTLRELRGARDRLQGPLEVARSDFEVNRNNLDEKIGIEDQNDREKEVERLTRDRTRLTDRFNSEWGEKEAWVTRCDEVLAYFQKLGEQGPIIVQLEIQLPQSHTVILNKWQVQLDFSGSETGGDE